MHIDLYLDSHGKIIKAISQGKPSKAEELMRKHILDAKRFIISEQIRF